MKEHYSNGVTAPSSAHLQTAAYEEEIRQLKLRVQELEDWNETPSGSLRFSNSHLHSFSKTQIHFNRSPNEIVSWNPTCNVYKLNSAIIN